MKPLDALGGTGTKSGPDININPLYHKYLCVTFDGKKFQCGGQDHLNDPPGGLWGPGKPSNDKYKENRCKEVSDNVCIDRCILKKILSPHRPPYGLFGPGTNCQEWANETFEECLKKCQEK